MPIIPSPEPTIAPTRPELAAWLARPLHGVDALFNRIYSSRFNPLYQSGSLAILFLTVCVVTGLYLFLFYRVGDPYESVAAIEHRLWGGSLVRSLHRYASDLAMAAVAVHALRMFVAGRTWGPRALSWIMGIVLLGSLLACGWTGLVMVWDVQAQVLAIEGTRLLDLLPIFSQPISRSFLQPQTVPPSFFFMNLFLHVALPLGAVTLLALHLTKVARPKLWPPRAMAIYALGVLALYAILVPAPLPPAADLLSIPANIPTDFFFGFWLPVAQAVTPAQHLLLWLALLTLVFSVPWWWRPKRHAIAPSQVVEKLCTGCSQCYHDCPFEAISMVKRQLPSKLTDLVAQIDPELCVACGICSGSCAPMGLGPPGRDGREQLHGAEDFIQEYLPASDRLVLFACRHSSAQASGLLELEAVDHYPIGCTGSLHTSLIELMLRRGASGVVILGCPPRDCLYREGPRWLVERVYHDREAELRDRVDKRRVLVVSAAPGEGAVAAEAIARFRHRLRGLGPQTAEARVELELECEVPPEARLV